ncbi:MAG: thioredoxin family protein [Promethearchaeota archaeon]
MLNNKVHDSQMKKLVSPNNSQNKPYDILNINYLKEIDDLVLENPKLNLVMDFWAEWCSPCKAFSLVFEQLNEEYGEYFLFAKINIELDKKIEWKYKITSIPTFIIMRNGKLVYMCSEIIDYPKLREVLNVYKDTLTSTII